MMHLVTGHAGIEHIKPSDDGAFNAGVVGTGKYVFDLDNKFEYEIVSNNLVKIKDGELVNQGRHANIPVNNYEEVPIENGLQGVKRYDLICARYTKNADTSIESVEMVVIKGTSSANPSDPACVEGNILEGALIDDFPLYRVRLDGLNIVGVDRLFEVIPSLVEVNEKVENIKDNLSDIVKKVSVIKENVVVKANSFAGDTITPPEHEGYKPIGIIGYSYNTLDIIMYNCTIDNKGDISYALNNKSSSQITIPYLVFFVLYVRDI